MTVSICYIYPSPYISAQFEKWAMRFVESYNAYPPGIQHETIVVLNAHKQSVEVECMFCSLQNVKFLEHDNSGFDIGGYQCASRKHPADLMVFFGSSAYLKRPNWLLRFAEARVKHGDTLYGTHGNKGYLPGGIHPHVRTTGFAISSHLLNQYPHKATKPEHRYAWEHGPQCLTSWINKRGLIPWIVAGDSEYKWESWDHIVNGYRKGNQSNLLAGDRLTSVPYGMDAV